MTIWLAVLEDRIFEGLPDPLYKQWPLQFSEAINTGATLDNIKIPFLVYLLEYNLQTLDSIETNELVENSKRVIKQTIAALQSGDEKEIKAAQEAAEAAETIAEAAWLEFAEKLLQLMRECKE